MDYDLGYDAIFLHVGSHLQKKQIGSVISGSLVLEFRPQNSLNQSDFLILT